MKRLMRCAPGRSSSPAAHWTVRLNLNGGERSPVCVGRRLMVLGAQRTRFQTEFRRCWVRLCRRLCCWVVGSARGVAARGTFWLGLPEQDSSLPAPPVPLPHMSLAVAPLYVPGSKPRCPRACLTSTPTLGSGMAAVPFSAEASPVCPVRAPGVSPAAGSVPPGPAEVCVLPPCGPVLRLVQLPPLPRELPGAGPAALSAQHTDGGTSAPLRSDPRVQRGAAEARWWPRPRRRPPEPLLCVPARPFPGCLGSWAFLLVRAAGRGEGSRALHLKVAS